MKLEQALVDECFELERCRKQLEALQNDACQKHNPRDDSFQVGIGNISQMSTNNMEIFRFATVCVGYEFRLKNPANYPKLAILKLSFRKLELTCLQQVIPILDANTTDIITDPYIEGQTEGYRSFPLLYNSNITK